MQLRFKKLHRHIRRQQYEQAKRFRRLRAHPVMVPIVTFAVLISLTAIGWQLFSRNDAPVTDAFVVIISHDHQEQTVPSREPTVGSLLKKLHLSLNEGDVVEPSQETPINQEDFRINIYRAVPVEVIDNGQRTFAFSAATTPRSIAEQVGIKTFAEDGVVTQPVHDFVAEGALTQKVVIDRATPVNINLYGALTVTRTRARTVAEFMRTKGIKLAKDDQVTPAPNTPITPNMPILVARNGTKVETITEQIPMPQQIIQDPTLAFGTSAIRQQGSPGQQITTYQAQLVNGIVVGRTVIQKVVTQAPITQVVVQGTSLSGIKADMALAGISPGDYNYVDYIVSHESGWCPTKAQGQYGGCPPYAGYVPATGGYGLCQSTPGSKMATAGADWATNPVTQLRWCHGYAQARYGSWAAAYNYWLGHHNW